ncbi:MAG: hypothetical protein HWE18_14710 [Gammaproteobacteria bacterium]|nr:hypothetical protein [Gammaproteobacteria bacterium]
MMLRDVFCWTLLCCVSLSSWGDRSDLLMAGQDMQLDAPWYTVSAIQLGLHSLDTDNEEVDLTSVGEGVYFAIGRPVLPIMSLEVGVDFWFNDEEDEDPVDHAVLHDFHFAGISVGTNAIFHFPGGEGPYAKVGRHCWSASAYDAWNVWNGNGCSNLFGGGLFFGEGKGFFLEATRTRYKRVHSWFLSAGIKF